MSKKILIFSFVVMAAVVAAACGSGSNDAVAGKPVKSGAAGNNLTATISNADGVLRKGKQEFTLTFTDASGKQVDVGSVGLNYNMPAMGTMPVMNSAATFTTTNTPGVYRGKAEVDMAGEWQAQIVYDGPAGKGKFSLPITVQ